MGILAVIVLFAVIGISVIVSGYRGRAVACDPVCAKCGYDLRGFEVMTRCSECGSDLNAPGTVRRNTFQASRRKMVGGLLLVALPWCFIALMTFLDSLGPNWERVRSNHSLISAIDENANHGPWLWDELTRRLSSGRLSKPEATAVVDQLIALMARHQSLDDPQFGDASPYWATSFIAAADQANVISSVQYLEMAQACYGMMPDLQFPSSVQGDLTAQFHLHPALGRHILPGFHEELRVQEISMSGVSAQPQDIIHRPGQGNMAPPNINLLSRYGYLISAPNVPEGRYQVKFIVQSALVRGPGSGGWPLVAPASPLTPPVAQWTETITMPLDVGRSAFTAERPYKLTLRTDAAADPQPGLSIASAHALCNSDVTTVIIHLKVDHVPIGCCFVRKIIVDGKQFSEGSMSVRAGGPTFDDVFSCELDTLPKEITTVDVELTPDIDGAKKAWLEQIWGKPITFKNIPLHRLEGNFSLSQWKKDQWARDAKAAGRLTTLPSPATAPAR